MSLLVVQLPDRPRLHPQGPHGCGTRTGTGLVLSPDGRTVQSEGRCAARCCPRPAPRCWLAVRRCGLPPHRLAKAPLARLRVGAGRPGRGGAARRDRRAASGRRTRCAGRRARLMAAIDRDWLVAQIGAIEASGRAVDRIVPMLWPDTLARGHFHVDPPTPPRLRLSWPTRRVCRPGRWRARWRARCCPSRCRATRCGRPSRPPPRRPSAGWASRCRSPVRPSCCWPPPRALEPAPVRAGTAPPRSGPVREGAGAVHDPAWRPVRLGLLGLVLVQVVGLNAWAWLQSARSAAAGWR